MKENAVQYKKECKLWSQKGAWNKLVDIFGIFKKQLEDKI